MTLLGFTFHAILNVTNVELLLFIDFDKNLFIENIIRGGITSCVKWHAIANNSYLETDYNDKLSNSYLIYRDCNNLYKFSLRKAM